VARRVEPRAKECGDCMEKCGACDRSSREQQEEWSQEPKSVVTVWRSVELMTGARESDNECMGKSGAHDRSSRE
jgi:hypothetical protein